jgi:hypothetical protein
LVKGLIWSKAKTNITIWLWACKSLVSENGFRS